MIKLILAILLPVLFLANYWACECLYPGADKDWAIFIPMDELCHNFWSVIMLGYAIISTIETKYKATDFFLFLAVNFSLCDIMDRMFHLYSFNPKYYIIAIISSFLFSGVAYGVKYKR